MTRGCTRVDSNAGTGVGAVGESKPGGGGIDGEEIEIVRREGGEVIDGGDGSAASSSG